MSPRRLVKAVISATPLPMLMLRNRARRGLTILGYHRVLPALELDYPFSEHVVSATPEEFGRELKYLRTNLDVISIRELLTGLHNPRLLPQRPAVLTFDDGYVDNYRHAFPLLRNAGMPACFFVCTGFMGDRYVPWHESWVCCLKRSHVTRIDSPFYEHDAPFELDAANRNASIARFRRRMCDVHWSKVSTIIAHVMASTRVNPQDYLTEPLFMNPTMIKEMANAGMEIGGHTRHHPILSRVDDASLLRSEIAGCYDDLYRMIARQPLAFAYPFGYEEYMSAAADHEIRRAGFQMSFSFIHGFAERQAGALFRIPRLHASYGADHREFRFRTAIAPQVRGLTPQPVEHRERAFRDLAWSR